MNIQSLSIPLQVSPEYAARLRSLQETFALVCNALAPVVKETRCWNRVALHHMMYKTLRENFPQLGSQMVCNAIYSVSRTSRLVFQTPQSPFNIQLMGDKPLPLLQFLPSAPVYFDRHTLSLKEGSLSMFTLDGRMRFELNMNAEDLNRFKSQKLHEIILQSQQDQFTLSFSFGVGQSAASTIAEEQVHGDAYLPEYVVLDQQPDGQPNGLANLAFNPLHSVHALNASAKISSGGKTFGIHLQLSQPMNTVASALTTTVPSSMTGGETKTVSSSDTSTISIKPLGARL